MALSIKRIERQFSVDVTTTVLFLLQRWRIVNGKIVTR
jgi:hypothetical protein